MRRTDTEHGLDCLQQDLRIPALEVQVSSACVGVSLEDW